MRVVENLKNQQGNYILPFFWQHGESEEVLREYVNAIKNANIDEMCLEARPHPDFAGEQWFHDFDIILDEAKKLDMKIWILDDAHFPSGQAAGHMDEQPDSMQKTYLNYNTVDITGPCKSVMVEVEPMAHYYDNPFKGNRHPFIQPDTREYTDPEKMIAVVLGRLDGKFGDMYHVDELIDVTEQVKDGVLTIDVEDGTYRLWVIYETHKGGGRAGSINFLSKASCRIQVENCYEPHWNRYKDEFGKHIVGFFSDEPEIGNSASYSAAAGRIGNPSMPLPWSEEMPALMEERFGKDYAHKIVALWNAVGSEEFTADMRVGYMDIVSRLCQRNFGEQMGDWCREHGVLYIGHIVEDCDASPNLAASQGHFFRALWGQDWSGIDNIGGQVTIGGANKSHANFLGVDADGEFYHHELAKMGTSLADIDPKKHGNTMCETFGAYGWEEGTRLMKYEADHLMVRGINHFVPHAFDPKEFPDFDCPPHFYAHGKNPLYKPFGTLMTYMNRVSHLITGGFHEVKVAVLYHAEAEWAGKEYMDMGKVGRFLDDAQIDFDYIPADVFSNPKDFDSFYDEDGLHINGHVFTSLVIPGLEYITEATRDFIKKAKETDFLVLCANRVPEGFESELAPTPLEDLATKLTLAGQSDAVIEPKNADIEIYHYNHGEEDYYLINNESSGTVYEGVVELDAPVDAGVIYAYDAMKNELHPVKANVSEKAENRFEVWVKIHPFEMLVLVVPKTDQAMSELAAVATPAVVFDSATEVKVSGDWKVTFCLNENYPNFADEMMMSELTNLNLHKTDWSGVARYVNTVEMDAKESTKAHQLCIEDAYESVEVWVNGAYAGEKIAPPYAIDITGMLQSGANEIVIECRTTLERLVHGITHGMGPFGPEFAAVKPSGLIGEVVIK